MAKLEYPTSIRLAYDLKRFLKFRARKQGCSMAFMMNQIIRDAYEAALSSAGGTIALLYEKDKSLLKEAQQDPPAADGRIGE